MRETRKRRRRWMRSGGRNRNRRRSGGGGERVEKGIVDRRLFGQQKRPKRSRSQVGEERRKAQRSDQRDLKRENEEERGKWEMI